MDIVVEVIGELENFTITKEALEVGYTKKKLECCTLTESRCAV
jgi:hypothetical protein